MPVKTSKPVPSKLAVIRADALSSVPWVVHAFSTRRGGFSRVYGKNSLNLGFTKQDSRAAVERNRAAFVKMLGVSTRKRPWPLITLRQIHSDIIHYVSEAPAEAEPLAGDGLITDTPGLLLGIQAADCLPIVLVDKKHQAVGVFHAGWRGTAKRIAEKGVGEMRRRFGSKPADIRAAIGPGIHNCCYTVGPEVRSQYEAQFAWASDLFRETKDSEPIREKYPLLFLTSRAPGHSELPQNIFLDLVEANRRQLLDAGVTAKNIEASELCTSCRTDVLFSHRAENGHTGRMMGVVGIRG